MALTCWLPPHGDPQRPPPNPPIPPSPSSPASRELSGVLVADRETFGTEITCRTGEYRADKVPSDPLDVTVKYGTSTSKTITNAFHFLENPIVLDHTPQGSFVWSVWIGFLGFLCLQFMVKILSYQTKSLEK